MSDITRLQDHIARAAARRGEETPNIREPTVTPPEPERWLSPEESPPQPIIEPNLCSPSGQKDIRDVTSHGIAERLLRELDERYRDAVVFARSKLWLYSNGVFAPTLDPWLDGAIQLYHMSTSIQQDKKEEGAGMPWISNPGNRGAVRSELETMLRRRQLSSGEDPFAGSHALPVFGPKTLIYDPGKRTVTLEDNSPEWRATFAYPFEFSFEPREPHWLLRILREDTFAGVEEKERELRIERIRQQMGLAMLGCQRMTNLHNVLVLKGHGHDGKSTLLDLLRMCMPPDSHISMSPQALSQGTGNGAEGRARLAGKYAVVCDDISEASMKDSSHYKTATAYGMLDGRFFGSGSNSFDFVPRATWFLACQTLWKTDDKTQGFQRRHCIVEFPNSISESKADRALARRLYSLERADIIVWACQAAVELLRGGKLAKPACSERLMRNWMKGACEVVSFVESCTVDVSTQPHDSWVTIDDIHMAYVRWCPTIGAHPHAQAEFSKRAHAVPGFSTARVTRGGKRSTVCSRALLV